MSSNLAAKTLAPSSAAPNRSIVAEDLKDVLRSMYRNRYFTNHGPLAKEFERLLEVYLDIAHVVSVGNESLALLIAVAGLETTGEIVIPAYHGGMAPSIVAWLGLRATCCDVDSISHQVSIQSISPVLTKATEAVLLVETWGNRCDRRLVDFLVARDLRVVIIAFDSFASEAAGRYVIDDPRVVTVHGFGPGHLMTTLQGGAVATSNDEFAHRFRNIRSSYGVREARRVMATCNGRFSELQAGVGIKSFSQLEHRRAHYDALGAAYRSILAECEGIEVYKFPHTQVPNGQFFPIQIKKSFPLSRDALIARLGLGEAPAASSEYFDDTGRNTLGKVISPSFPVAQRLAARVVPLPINSKLEVDTALQLSERIARIAGWKPTTKPSIAGLSRTSN